jgi:hypothetical protein
MPRMPPHAKQDSGDLTKDGNQSAESSPIMFSLDKIAETRITEAMQRGDFDNLPGAGCPLKIDGNQHIPQDLRVAYRILKNAGCIPPDLELRREIAQVEQLIPTLGNTLEKDSAAKRINYLMACLGTYRGRELNLRLQEDYYQKLCKKFQCK